jgi:hypothetical protein
MLPLIFYFILRQLRKYYLAKKIPTMKTNYYKPLNPCMKKIIILFLLLYSVTGSAQAITDPPPQVQTDYIRKSHTQKTIAWTMLAGGSVLVFAGVSTALQDVYLFSFNTNGQHYKKGTALFTIGCAAMLGSIPFFISGARCKKRHGKQQSVLKWKKQIHLMVPPFQRGNTRHFP